MKYSLSVLLIALFCTGGGCKHLNRIDACGHDTVAEEIASGLTRDLRELFQKEDVIARLEKKGVCLVRYWKAEGEVEVGSGLSVDKVILKFMRRPYDGQVKVVSQDHIAQTSLMTYNPAEQKRILVSPGDLVFIQGRD